MKHLIGNTQVKKYFKQIIDRKMVGNSFLFSGREGIGKGLFAKELAIQLIGNRERIEHNNHPDVREFRPEGKIGMHSMDSLKELIQSVHLVPYEAKHKIYIIHDADRMLPTSSNALLKTFEEPPLDTIIILLSNAPERLLPTITSRCRRISFQPISQKEMVPWLVEHEQIERKVAEQICLQSKGSLSQAIRLLQKDGYSIQDKILKVLAQMPCGYQLIKESSEMLGKEISENKEKLEKEARDALEHANVKELNATQKATLEKEILGLASVHALSEVDTLLEAVLSWFRDLHLVSLNGKKEELMNPHFFSALTQRAQKGNLTSIERVQQAVQDARLSIQRFSPVAFVLEALLLKVIVT